jgi:predicted extracellular nuclease
VVPKRRYNGHLFLVNTTNYMRNLLFVLAFVLSTALAAQEVIITGIVDGTSSGSPRAVELYVSGTVDLSNYVIERYSNGATATNGATETLTGSYTDAFVYVINNQHDAAFTTAWGSAGDFSNRIPSNIMFGNGNDVFAVSLSGTIVDQVANDIGVGVNTYRDSWLYRNDNTGPDGAWVPANWMNVENNDALDGLDFAAMGAAVPFGTYMTTPPGPSVMVSAINDLDEDGTNGGFVLTLSEVSANNVTVDYSFSGMATENVDYTDAESGSVTITAGDLTANVNLTVIDDAESEITEDIILTVDNVSDATFSAGATGSIQVFDNEPITAMLIHDVQGSGTTSPLLGLTLSVEGIVVGDFQGGTGVGLGGFFIQEEDADADADAMTSEGIWIYDDTGAIDVNVGDLVTVTGIVEEASDLTEINVTGATASVTIVSSGNTLPTAASLDLPVSADSDYEAFEGMLTTLVDDVTVTETFGLARFGEFDVSEGERLIQYTECNTSNPGALGAYNDAQDRRRLTIDDGRSGDNVYPIILGDGMEMSAANPLRSGTVLSAMTGVVDERFTGYRFQATGFTRNGGNDRPASAPNVGGNITVVGMNVLNYFTTLGSRGADDADEFDRQEAKIVNAIIELDADILGLVEIENNGFGASSALQTLINAIAAAGGSNYSFVTNSNSGGDAIQVALIYKGDVVEESGTAANIATPADVFSSNRIPLAQTFRVKQMGNPNFGQEVTVCVNHWKSKGSSCGGGDDDTGGAGNCNGTRDAAAAAIAAWLATNPTGVNEPDQLVIGDLNAYSAEDPIMTMLNAGFVNTVADLAPGGSFPCETLPSYVFRGEWGSLDHALASSSLSTKVTGSIPWDVCASEPTALDYDTRFNDPALYADDFYRFSDHNPIVIGLDLGASLPIELTSFSGEIQNGEVVLSWETAIEINTDRFEVLKQNSAGDFVSIGTVAAAGNSDTPRSYSFTDENPVTGDNQYQLRIIDLDATETFSDIVTVNVEDTNRIEVVRNGLNTYRLSGARVGTAYLLTDAGGAVLRRGTVTSETEDINGDGLPTGIYFLVVENNGRSESFKLILR